MSAVAKDQAVAPADGNGAAETAINSDRVSSTNPGSLSGKTRLSFSAQSPAGSEGTYTVVKTGANLDTIDPKIIRLIFGFLAESEDYLAVDGCDLDKKSPLLSFNLIFPKRVARPQDFITRLSMTIDTTCPVVGAAKWLFSAKKLTALDLNSKYNRKKKFGRITEQDREFYVHGLLDFGKLVRYMIEELRLTHGSNYGLEKADFASIKKTGVSLWTNLSVLQFENVIVSPADAAVMLKFLSGSPLQVMSFFWDSYPQRLVRGDSRIPEREVDLSWLENVKGLSALALCYYGNSNQQSISVAPATLKDKKLAGDKLRGNYNGLEYDKKRFTLPYYTFRLPETMASLDCLYLDGYNSRLEHRDRWNFPQLRILVLVYGDWAIGEYDTFVANLVAPRLEALYYYNYSLRSPGETVRKVFNLPDGCKLNFIVPYRGGRGRQYTNYVFNDEVKMSNVVRGYGLLTEADLVARKRKGGGAPEYKKTHMPVLGNALYDQLKLQKMHYGILYRYRLEFITDDDNDEEDDDDDDSGNKREEARNGSSKEEKSEEIASRKRPREPASTFTAEKVDQEVTGPNSLSASAAPLPTRALSQQLAPAATPTSTPLQPSVSPSGSPDKKKQKIGDGAPRNNETIVVREVESEEDVIEYSDHPEATAPRKLDIVDLTALEDAEDRDAGRKANPQTGRGEKNALAVPSGNRAPAVASDYKTKGTGVSFYRENKRGIIYIDDYPKGREEEEEEEEEDEEEEEEDDI